MAEQDGRKHELTGYVDIWWQAVDDLTTLLEGLDPEDWRRPTDLAGWDVHAVVAHTAHLESLLAGGEHADVDVSGASHVRNALGTFTEQGVVARRDRTPDELLVEVRESATRRRTALLADPPTDPDAPAPGAFGMVGWSTLTLLRNRPLDVWMHEQDVRRAVGRPGNLDSPAALHTVDYLSESLGLVLAKRVGAPAGTTAAVRVEGRPERRFRVGDDGRGHEVAASDGAADTTLDLGVEAFALLAGGRRPADSVDLAVTGDADLGRRLAGAMAVTP
ncbi:maleylpyruvate isomerase family mycothiol-dependent enzyme [Nocardioides solisilvae]|uniref:maleylpyruvate isomerase family mycothiol-dependent enzyme n=1 Tax=Nocardioides solisilvae TaxID=1542435 RepID=UPI000D74CB98|nr:maleylpyruvate isomerase family mycothiol-dependent enzyme [Nocardioides solisilvae]